MILTIFIGIANVLGAGMIVPQLIRLLKTGDVRGVSIAWIGVGISTNAMWVMYGIAAALPGLVPVSAVSTVLYSIIALLLRNNSSVQSFWLPLAKGCITPTAAPILLLATLGIEGAGAALGITYAVQFAPAAYEAVFARELSGISRTTWFMAWGEAAIWLSYGLQQGDIALRIGGGGGLVCASLILVRLFFWHHRPRLSGEPQVELPATSETIQPIMETDTGLD